MLNPPIVEVEKRQPTGHEGYRSAPPVTSPRSAAPRLRPSQIPRLDPPAHLPPSVVSVLRSAGRPLEPDPQTDLERHFGETLDDVQLHTDATGAASAQAINARAYTFGNHIVFGRGQYSPGSPTGDGLLRHEIAHVLQQRSVTSVEPGLSAPPFFEKQAERASSITGAYPSITVRPAAGIARIASQSDLAMLSDHELEAEQLGLEAWLQQHTATDELYNQNVAYLANIHSVLRQRQPARAARAERLVWEKELIKVGGAVAILGGPVLGLLGIGPVAGTFLYEFGQGLAEGIDEQPLERKQMLLNRFDKLYFSWGDWDDKLDYFTNYIDGIVLGAWGEIEGMWKFVVMLYELNQKVNAWLLSTASQLSDLQAIAEKGRAVYDKLSAALAKLLEEIAGFVKDPEEGKKKLRAMLDSLVEGALTKANELGHDAVDRAFSFLSEPYPQLGMDLGKVAGVVIFNVLLLVATDAIGNLIKEGAALAARVGKAVLGGIVDVARGIGSFFTRVWEAIRGFGRKLFSGETLDIVGKAISEFIDWLASLMKLPERVPLPAEGPALGELEELGKAGRLESRAARPPGGPKVQDLYPPQETYVRPLEPADVEPGLADWEKEGRFETGAGRAGAAAPPKHHVFPQEMRAWFEERGFKGANDIDNFTVELDQAEHQAIHGGGDWRLGRTWPGEWNQLLERELLDAEKLVGGRKLGFDEITTIVKEFMVEYGIDKPFVPYR